MISDHSRVIVHIDIDCFYAQVEEILNPELRTKNVGIKQKNYVVTCNYNARRHGVRKLQFISEALQNCPDLILVNGEDLAKYRAMSDQIFEVLSRFNCDIEKLGMDENFIDVTRLVLERGRSPEQDPETFVESGDEECDCGCVERLKAGTVVAQEMRKALHDELGITSCAGIAYNKLLAKLVGSRHKPNKQTVIFDSAVAEVMRGLQGVREICGIGHKMAETLESLGIKTVVELQDVGLEVLKKKIDPKTAEKLKGWAFGTDNGEVRPSGKPKSLGVEDSTFGNPLKNLYEVETKFSQLISKLLAVSKEDGRLPSVLKVTVRKTSTLKEINQRESKQAPLSKSFSSESLIQQAMSLFKKILPESQFAVTLLGVAFTKFQEEGEPKNSITRFLKKEDPAGSKEVQVSPSERKRAPKETVSPPPAKKSKLLEWMKRGSEVKVTKDQPSTSRGGPEGVKVPPNVDLEIFNALPEDVKKELVQQWNGPPKVPAEASKKPSIKSFFKPR